MRMLKHREVRLLAIAALLACIVPFAPRFNPQLRHLQQVERHITIIRPQWEDFKRQNAGFEFIQFFSYTGGDGLFGAYGYVPSEQHLASLKAFMESTNPPRPLYLKAVLVVAQEEFDDLARRTMTEPDAPSRRR